MAAAPRTQRQKEIRRHLWIYGAITPYVIVAIFPIYWMALTAFKQDPDRYRMDQFPLWFHLAPTWKHFRYLFTDTNYGAWIVNTMVIAVWVAVITLLIAVPAGYALARLRIPGSENLGIAVFMTYLVPGIILFLPLSRIVSMLGLQDSWWALVVVYPTITIPFCTWLLMGFFKTVPMEMEEAARVDGCGYLGALVRVVLPVSVPGVLNRIGTSGVADVEQQVLDGLARTVGVIVPPAAVVHERLARGVVLRALHADRSRLVLGRERSLDDVDVRRHAELLAARLPAR